MDIEYVDRHNCGDLANRRSLQLGIEAKWKLREIEFSCY